MLPLPFLALVLGYEAAPRMERRLEHSKQEDLRRREVIESHNELFFFVSCIRLGILKVWDNTLFRNQSEPI